MEIKHAFYRPNGILLIAAFVFYVAFFHGLEYGSSGHDFDIPIAPPLHNEENHSLYFYTERQESINATASMFCVTPETCYPLSIDESRTGSLIKHVCIEVATTFVFHFMFGGSGSLLKIVSKLPPLKLFSKRAVHLHHSTTHFRKRRLWAVNSAFRPIPSSPSTSSMHSMYNSLPFKKLYGKMDRIGNHLKRNFTKIFRKNSLKTGDGIVAASDYTNLLDLKDDENEKERI